MDTTSSTPAAVNPFGAPNQPAPNPFGQRPAANPSPFGAQPNGTALPANVPTGPKSDKSDEPPNPYPEDATVQHPLITSYSSRDPVTKTLTMFKGRAVTYQTPRGHGNEKKKPMPMVRQPDGSLTKVWFPDGAPMYTVYTAAQDKSVYEKPEVQDAWRTFRSQGLFADGLMPEVPPKREWCTWDF
jgi:nucleoporin NUP42